MVFTKFSHFVFSRNFCISHFAKIFLRNFALFSLHFFWRKNAKFREKVCEMRPKMFAFYRETFRSLETLGKSVPFMFYPKPKKMLSSFLRQINKRNYRVSPKNDLLDIEAFTMVQFLKC